jgi:hypothetical protein
MYTRYMGIVVQSSSGHLLCLADAAAHLKKQSLSRVRPPNTT